MNLGDALAVVFHRSAFIGPLEYRPAHVLHVGITSLLQFLRQAPDRYPTEQ